jgi:hypothetical protein
MTRFCLVPAVLATFIVSVCSSPQQKPADDQSAPPAELKIKLSSSGLSAVSWNSDHLVYSFGNQNTTTTATRVPTSAEWREFWSALAYIQLETWDRAYDDTEIADGDLSWSVRIRGPKGQVETRGNGRYPDDINPSLHRPNPSKRFAYLIGAIDRLVQPQKASGSKFLSKVPATFDNSHAAKISQALQKQIEDFQQCEVKYLRGYRGYVRVSVVVTDDGSTKDPVLELSTLRNSVFEDCILHVFDRIEMKGLPAARVDFPLDFPIP